MDKKMFWAIIENAKIIYADFDYPETMSNFVRCMPSEQPSLGTLEENTRRLYDNWKKFLDIQKQKYTV